MGAFLLHLIVEGVWLAIGRAVQRDERRCPACGARLPVFQPPRTWREAWRGGRSCKACSARYLRIDGTPLLIGPP